jgi:hypothetical protein
MSGPRTPCFALLVSLAGWLVASSPASGGPPSALSGELTITAVEKQGGPPVPCRMLLKNTAGRPFNPKKVPFLQDHFVMPGTITLKLPLGNYAFELERGPEYPVIYGHFQINQYAGDSKVIELKRHVDMAAAGWWSGDVEVHRAAEEIPLHMAAEDLHVAQVINWWNDKGLSAPVSEPLLSTDNNRWYYLLSGGYARRGGKVLLLNGPTPLLFHATEPEYPSLSQLIQRGREQRVGWMDVAQTSSWDLPTLVANGQVDSIQIANGQILRDRILPDEKEAFPRDRRRFPDPLGNPQWSQDIYFRLLNCGLRIPPSAGSASGVSPNPVGANRVYVHVDGTFSWEKWWAGLRAGRAVVTNGPLLRPSVDGQLPGYVFQLDEGQTAEFEIGLTLSLREPISYLDIIKNGRLEHSVRFREYAQSGRLPPVKFDRSGWFLVRAVTDLPKTYRFGMTAPYYVQIGYAPTVSRSAAQFFLDWVYERARQLQLADPAQRAAVLEYHRKARDFWQALLSKANAE